MLSRMKHVIENHKISIFHVLLFLVKFYCIQGFKVANNGCGHLSYDAG